MNELLNELKNDTELPLEEKITLLDSWINEINRHLRQTIMDADELKGMIKKKNLIEALQEELIPPNTD